MNQALDPQALIQIGMKAVIRDLQEFLKEHSKGHGDDAIPVRLLRAHLLQALVEAGGSETPLRANDPISGMAVMDDGES